MSYLVYRPIEEIINETIEMRNKLKKDILEETDEKLKGKYIELLGCLDKTIRDFELKIGFMR